MDMQRHVLSINGEQNTLDMRNSSTKMVDVPAVIKD